MEKKEYHYKIEPRNPFGYDGLLYSSSLGNYYIVAKGYFTKRGCRKAIIRYIKKEKKREKELKFLLSYISTGDEFRILLLFRLLNNHILWHSP